MLHGFLSSSAQWMHNIDALSRVCRPVTIDLWGHGQSAAPEAPELYLPEHYIKQLEHIRAELGAEQWFVCGYSLGAGITMRYTHQHPERVLAQLLTNSTSGFAHAKQVAQWQADAEDSAQRILDGGTRAIERIAVHPRFAKRLPADIYDALVDDAARLSPIGIAQTLRNTTPNASVREIAAENPRPALLCFGRLEKRFQPYKNWAAEHMAQLNIAELDAGHAVNMEDSAGFNKAACEFITQHTP